ncbi:MAG: AI-2E family transporter, partial [Myxococcota bacterium]
DEDDEGDLSEALSEALESMATDTRSTAGALLATAQSVIRTVVKGVFTFFIMLILSAYMLITSDRILAFCRSMWPQRRRRNFDRLVLRIDRGLAGVVRGQLLIALVNGVLSGIGFYLLDLRYWPILTLVATLLSVIPIFGAIISTIPAVVIALQSGLSTAVFTLLWIVGIHQIEANLLNPKIMGDSAKVHPVLVIFALLAGEALFGIAGALLAVPVLSIVQSLFLHYRETVLGVPKRADASTSDAGASVA